MIRFFVFVFLLYSIQLSGQCSWGSITQVIDSGHPVSKSCLELLLPDNHKNSNATDSLLILLGHYSEKSRSESTRNNFLDFAEQFLSAHSKSSNKFSRFLYDLGLKVLRNEPKIAKQHFLHAIKFYRYADILDSVQIGKALLNIGVCEQKIGEIDSAVYYLQKVQHDSWPIPVKNDGFRLQALGRAYAIKGNMTLSTKYFNLSATRLLESGSDSSYIAKKILTDIALYYFNNEMYHEAKHYLTSALDILSQHNQTYQAIDEKINYANTLRRLKEYDESIELLNDLLSTVDSSKNPILYFRIQLNLTSSHLDKADLANAHKMLIKQDEFLPRITSSELIKQHSIINWGQYYRQINAFEKAIDLQKQYLLDCCDLTIAHALNTDYQSFSLSKLDQIITVLRRLAVIHRDRYEKNKNEGDFTKAYRYHSKIIDILDFYKLEQLDPKSAIDLGAITADLVEEALTLAAENLEQAALYYPFLEKAKSSALLAGIKSSNIFRSIQEANPYFKKLDSLKETIIRLENNLMTEQIDSIKTAINEEIIELNQELYSTQRRINDLAFQDEKLGNIYDNVSLPELQSAIDNNTTVLSYFLADETTDVYIFKIDKSSIELLHTKRPAAFSADMEILTDFNSSFTEASEWIAANKRVSATLLPIELEKIGAKVIIIPDGVLNTLPFDILIADTTFSPTTSLRSLPYLIKDKTISYSFSASLLLEMQQKNSQGKGLLTMAQRHDTGLNQSSSTPLAHTTKEVDGIKNTWGHVLHISSNNKKEFLQQAEAAQLVHFAGHAYVDDEDSESSYLAFSSGDDIDDKLFLREVYNMRTTADMIVLSACQTGRGKIKQGEGAMSLTRAFAFAGAKSLVYSLWDVNDASTRKIMDRFYQELKSGAQKDVALRTSKLAYLESAIGRTQHPAYWAGFVAMGDMSSIPGKSKLPWIVIFLGMVALAIGLVARRKYKLRT